MAGKFVFNKIQRNGIFGLILIILVLFGLMLFQQKKQQTEIAAPGNSEEEIRIRRFIDSLKNVEKTKVNTPEILPFNPNYLTDYRGYVLGMSPKEIDRLHDFRKQNNWVNSVADFQKVTGVSDSLLAVISPYFKFPEWVTEQRAAQAKTRVQQSSKLSFAQKSDLNTATAEELMEIKGVGEVLSVRIIRHRNQLKGFVDDIQLKDIYGLNYETRQNILDKFTVKTPVQFEKINLNTAGAAELTEVYYINYELARKIVQYRLTREGISSFEDLSNIEGFPVDRIDRLELYLKIENP